MFLESQSSALSIELYWLSISLCFNICIGKKWAPSPVSATLLAWKTTRAVWPGQAMELQSPAHIIGDVGKGVHVVLIQLANPPFFPEAESMSYTAQRAQENYDIVPGGDMRFLSTDWKLEKDWIGQTPEDPAWMTAFYRVQLCKSLNTLAPIQQSI